MIRVRVKVGIMFILLLALGLMIEPRRQGKEGGGTHGCLSRARASRTEAKAAGTPRRHTACSAAAVHVAITFTVCRVCEMGDGRGGVCPDCDP